MSHLTAIETKLAASERSARLYKGLLTLGIFLWIIIVPSSQRRDVLSEDKRLMHTTKDSSIGVTNFQYGGVYPMLRELRCGHENLEVPRLLQQKGYGRIIVDVGLAFDALETAAAVQNGFHVIGFEPNPANIALLRTKFQLDPRIHIIDLVPTDDVSVPWKMPDYVVRPNVDKKSGRGVGYIIAAGLDERNGVSLMTGVLHRYKDQAGTIGVTSNLNSTKLPAGAVPVAKLDDILPKWATHVTMLKIDTQGI